MPSSASKTYLILPLLGTTLALPRLPRLLRRRPETKCFLYYDGLHRFNQGLEERFTSDPDALVAVCTRAALKGDPAEVIAYVGGITVEEAATIQLAMPADTVIPLLYDVIDRLDGGTLVRFAWEQADEWGCYWPPMPDQHKVAVVVVLGPSPF